MAKEFKHSFKAGGRENLPLLVYNVGYQRCPGGYSWGPGVRDHFLLHHVVSGRGQLELGGRTFDVSPGDAFLIRPDSPVCYRADDAEPWEYYWVGFSGASANLLLAATGFASQSPVLAAPPGGQLRQALLDIYKARGSDYPSAVRMAGYLQAALGLLMETVPTGADSLGDYARRGAAFVQQNYSRPVGVEEVAAAVGVSRSTLYRAFQTTLRCSPSSYLTGYRIQRACQLLRHSGLSVGAVATSIGFEDHLYFSRVFRRAMGVSPSRYREQEKKNAPGL